MRGTAASDPRAVHPTLVSVHPEPLARLEPESLLAWARAGLHAVEHGLVAVADGLDCGGGAAELLARDALGAPVVVVVATAADRTAAARVIAAHDFLARNPGCLPRLLPECGFDARLAPRITVVSAGLAAHGVESLRRLAIDELEVLEVEWFQLGGTSRAAVRRLVGPARPEPSATALGDTLSAVWRLLGDAVSRLDPTLHVDGDRHARRVLMGGRLLGCYWAETGSVFALVPGGAAQRLRDTEDAAAFVDVLLRRYAALLAGGSVVQRADSAPTAAPVAGPDVDAIRQHLAASRLTSDR